MCDLRLCPPSSWNLRSPGILNVRLLMSYIYIYIYIYMEHPFLMFLDHTQRRTTVGRAPQDERSARRRDFYLTTHDTHNRQISMPQWDSKPRFQQVSGLRPLTCWDLGFESHRPEESYRLCCVVVCDLETSRIGAPYIYNVKLLRVNENVVRIVNFAT